MANDSRDAGHRRAVWLLGLGAAVGLALAASSLLSAPGAGGPSLPEGSVARVNGTLIRSDDLERLLAALASDRRTPLTDEDRRRVLDRLIEEELLVQYAVSLGLVRTDRRVRGNLVSAVLAALNASTDGYDPSAEEVAEFYEENRDYFAYPARLQVREVFVAAPRDAPDGDALTRAQQAAARLRAGEAIDEVRAALGDDAFAPLPDAPLPPAKLREYLGPSALRVAQTLQPGEVSAPVRTPQGYHVLQLVARADSEAAPLVEVEPQVRAEMKRRLGDRLLRERLDSLRAEADVTLAPSLP
jgi:parvulin-like peptidyl-prolyl isomerase